MSRPPARFVGILGAVTALVPLSIARPGEGELARTMTIER
jgi:hypothetical protein